MLYATGELIVIGDSVTIENGRTSGTVRAVIDTQQLIAAWNVAEPGVLVEAQPFGFVFWPQREIPTLLLTQKK